MAEDTWQQARLIPTSGINGQEEAERRATSALLAVMSSVREFGLAMVKGFGAPSAQLASYIEVPFRLGERTFYPDGLIQSTRGSRTWTALVEVKTGTASLERTQVESYLDIARDNGFDAVLTISNEIAPAPGVHPVPVDKRKVRRVALHHLSWAEVLTTAVQQRVHRGVSDPDQAWILGELIRYLEHPRSGALDFSDMGASWVPVREAIVAGTLRSSDKGLPEVVSRWEQLLRFAALRLGRELGADVQVMLSRKETADPSIRFSGQARSLVELGVLTGVLRIPDAVAPLEVTADLRANRISVSVEVDAPREGRPVTRVNWLLRQLRDAPPALRVDAQLAGTRASMSELLGVVREDQTVLIDEARREIRSFRVAATSPLGAKRGTGRGSFIDSVLAAIDGFYAAVIQQLRPWTAKAPQLPKGVRTAAEQAGIDLKPPPKDLLDAHVSQASPTQIPEQTNEPQTLVADPEVVPGDTGRQHAATAGATGENEISWDDAHTRLEHERTELGGDRVARPSIDPQEPEELEVSPEPFRDHEATSDPEPSPDVLDSGIPVVRQGKEPESAPDESAGAPLRAADLRHPEEREQPQQGIERDARDRFEAERLKRSGLPLTQNNVPTDGSPQRSHQQD